MLNRSIGCPVLWLTFCHYAENQNAELGFSQASFANQFLLHTNYQREFLCMDFK